MQMTATKISAGIRLVCSLLLTAAVATGWTAAFETAQIADAEKINIDASVSADGTVAWSCAPRTADEKSRVDICIQVLGEQEIENLTSAHRDEYTSNRHPRFFDNRLIWISSFPKGAETKSVQMASPDNATTTVTRTDRVVTWQLQDPPPTPLENVGDETDTNLIKSATNVARVTTGDAELMEWVDGETKRLTSDYMSDTAPAASDELVVWQKARGWPFGWEIMLFDGSERLQLSTNYVYDMAPQAAGNRAVWYGWDGNDFEIFLYDHSNRSFKRITNNSYDDVRPVITDNLIAWEAYPAAEADIYIYDFENEQTRKISSNLDDDSSPSAWSNQVAWQGFDGEDYEIYLFDGERTVKLTSNTYDDNDPVIRDGIIAWTGFEDNWDAEIFAWDGEDITRLTENDYDDRNPVTAGGRIVWTATEEDKSYVFLAVPQ